MQFREKRERERVHCERPSGMTMNKQDRGVSARLLDKLADKG